MSKLEGNTATLSLCNTLSLKILIIDEDTLNYQFSNETKIHKAKIVLKKDTKNVTGSGGKNSEELPAFKASNGQSYFVNEFLRDGI